MTHVEFGDGAVYEVLNMIDDHSRLCVASRAMKVVKANDVVRVLHKAAETGAIQPLFSLTTASFSPRPVTIRQPGSPNKSCSLSASRPSTLGPTILRPAARWNASTRP